MRILITGAAGFIGSSLAWKLMECHDLFLLDIAKAGDLADKKWLILDLSQDFPLASLPERIDVVIHLAQSRNYRDYPGSALEVFNINTASTMKLLEYSRRQGVGRFIYASSGSVYSGGRTSYRESDLKRPPEEFYALSKYQSELLVRSYGRFMKTIILRFMGVYGPRQRGMLVSNLMQKVSRGEKIQLHGSKGLRLNPIYIDDAVEAISRSLEVKSSCVLNIGGVQALSIYQMGRTIGDVLGRDVQFDYLPGGDAGRLVGNISQMRTALEFVPSIRFKEGIKRIADSEMAQGTTQRHAGR